MSRKFLIRTKDHQKAMEQKKWSHSGITTHKEHCPLPVDWDNPEILAAGFHKNKIFLKYSLRLRESLEIQRHDTGPERGSNKDWGDM
jgi:hypothetical protein